MNKTDILQAYTNNPQLVERARDEMQAVLSRSATDAGFRQQLLTDSRSALSSHFGREIPAGVNISFIENSADATFVLPDAVDESAELTENELEAVAGGTVTPVEWIALGAAIYILIDVISD